MREIIVSCVIITLINVAISRKTKPSDLKLGFGSHVLDIYRPSPLAEGEQRLEVGDIISHPRYSE